MLEEQQNNPLHGLKLDVLVDEIVTFYGWAVLASELNLNCFKSNPSIPATLKFLRKTDWAREKVEEFYLYKFKSLPLPPEDQLETPPRARPIPLNQQPGEPTVIELKQNRKRSEDDPWAQFRKSK